MVSLPRFPKLNAAVAPTWLVSAMPVLNDGHDGLTDSGLLRPAVLIDSIFDNIFFKRSS